MADIKNVAIIGAGQMGCGIAHVFALAGYRVLLNDINAVELSAGLANIENNLARQVASEKISQSDSDAALALISTDTELADLADADLVIEAASEDENIKLEILQAVSALVSDDTLLGLQYIIHFHHPVGRANAPSGKLYRHAFHESGAGHAIGRAYSRHGHQR